MEDTDSELSDVLDQFDVEATPVDAKKLAQYDRLRHEIVGFEPDPSPMTSQGDRRGIRVESSERTSENERLLQSHWKRKPNARPVDTSPSESSVSVKRTRRRRAYLDDGGAYCGRQHLFLS
jgi:hypothetical protein